MSAPFRVLFVCLGNICRSPTGEGLLRVAVADQGLEELVEVDSAGTGAWHIGESPDGRMSAAAAERGYRLSGSSRQVTAGELAEWSMVVAMDRQNLADLQDLAGGREVSLRLFSEFLPPGAHPDVPDPYYGGGDGFDRVIDLLEEGCVNLLEELVAEEEGDGSQSQPAD
jgi:protein-tyrosine phosphatase